MTPANSVELTDSSPEELDAYVAAFEEASRSRRGCQLHDHLPPREHPRFLAILVEMIRVELDLGWARGEARTLEDYLAHYPELSGSPELIERLAFEEFRLRRRGGQDPDPLDYARRYGILVNAWPMPDRPAPPPDASLSAAAHALKQLLATRVVDRDEAIASWRADWRGDAAHADLLSELHRSSPATVDRLCDSLTALPRAGETCFGFYLIGELGTGTFGKVFLARQGELAGRLVVLKVASDALGESVVLAQMQHTHVVPIYSVHRSGMLQAFCMPYFGSTTFAELVAENARQPHPTSGRAIPQLIRRRKQRGAPTPVTPLNANPRRDECLNQLEQMSYPAAVLWLASRLAHGLAHAHDRGILHRDLKPANILLSDEGVPMLLDFNLSADMKIPGTMAAIGGTLPYMSPEQMEALRGGTIAVDARSDIYSLGLIMYELLAGQPPFARGNTGPLHVMIDQMQQERLRGVPPLRQDIRGITPAIEAIVRHCLEPSVERRYQSAAELAEDIERHLADQPLKHAVEPSWRERLGKWARRHPRLASPLPLAAAAAAVILLLVAAGVQWSLADRQRRQDETRQAFAQRYDDFRQDFATAEQLLVSDDRDWATRGQQLAGRLLDTYSVLDDPGWSDRPAVTALPAEDRVRLKREMSELAFLSTRAAVRLGDKDEPLRKLIESQGDLAASDDIRGRFLRAADQTSKGRFRDALPLLTEVLAEDPTHFGSWFLKGRCHQALGENEDALSCYGTCIVLRPNLALPYLARAELAFSRQKNLTQAKSDLDQAIRLQPSAQSAWINRALVRFAAKDASGALTDLDRAATLGAVPTRFWFIRERILTQLGQRAEARKARAQGMALEPEDPASFLARGVARLGSDVEGALADFRKAEKLEPRCVEAMINQSYVLAEMKKDTRGGLEVLERLLKQQPHYVTARGGRAVLLARLGRIDEALEEARWCQKASDHPENRYRVACIYALASKKRPELAEESKKLLALALLAGWGFEHVETDHDLDPLRKSPDFDQLMKSVKTLRGWEKP